MARCHPPASRDPPSTAARPMRPAARAPPRATRAVDGAAANPALDIEGLHVFTFNQVAVIESWRRRMLDEAVSARVRPPG